ncbi:hypothetical protein M885DRAFT_591658 [Pelagophyceae sp. CCMP2097]|nr:hypothetical protein M885DRAFT_591658 [Pelagophyceae sp. CCMP2097]
MMRGTPGLLAAAARRPHAACRRRAYHPQAPRWPPPGLLRSAGRPGGFQTRLAPRPGGSRRTFFNTGDDFIFSRKRVEEAIELAKLTPLLTLTQVIGGSCVLLSYYEEDLLKLRFYAVSGLFFFSLYPNYTRKSVLLLGWGLLFSAINGYRLFGLARQRVPVQLSEDEATLYEVGWHRFVTPQCFKRLASSAQWRTYAPGHRLKSEGEASAEFMVVLDGSVDVKAYGHDVGREMTGALLGVPDLVANDEDSGSKGLSHFKLSLTVGAQGARVLAFDVGKLKAVLAAERDFRAEGQIVKFFGEVLMQKGHQRDHRAALERYGALLHVALATEPVDGVSVDDKLALFAFREANAITVDENELLLRDEGWTLVEFGVGLRTSVDSKRKALASLSRRVNARNAPKKQEARMTTPTTTILQPAAFEVSAPRPHSDASSPAVAAAALGPGPVFAVPPLAAQQPVARREGSGDEARPVLLRISSKATLADVSASAAGRPAAADAGLKVGNAGAKVNAGSKIDAGAVAKAEKRRQLRQLVLQGARDEQTRRDAAAPRTPSAREDGFRSRGSSWLQSLAGRTGTTPQRAAQASPKKKMRVAPSTWVAEAAMNSRALETIKKDTARRDDGGVPLDELARRIAALHRGASGRADKESPPAETKPQPGARPSGRAKLMSVFEPPDEATVPAESAESADVFPETPLQQLSPRFKRPSLFRSASDAIHETLSGARDRARSDALAAGFLTPHKPKAQPATRPPLRRTKSQ